MRKCKPWAFWGSELSLLDLEANYYAREKRNAMDNTFFSHNLMDKHAFELIKEWTFLIKKKNESISQLPQHCEFPAYVCACGPPSAFLRPWISTKVAWFVSWEGERLPTLTEQGGLCVCALIYLVCWCLQTTVPKHRERWYGKPCTEHEVGCRNYVNGLE